MNIDELISRVVSIKGGMMWATFLPTDQDRETIEDVIMALRDQQKEIEFMHIALRKEQKLQWGDVTDLKAEITRLDKVLERLGDEKRFVEPYEFMGGHHCNGLEDDRQARIQYARESLKVE